MQLDGNQPEKEREEEGMHRRERRSLACWPAAAVLIRLIAGRPERMWAGSPPGAGRSI